MSIKTTPLTELLPKTNCRFSWGEIPLTETKWEGSDSYDLSAELTFEKALAVLSENLSFCEKLKIVSSVQTSDKTAFSSKLFFEEAKYTRYDLIEQVRKLTESLPESFTQWCSHKKLNLKDFRAFLNDFKKENDSTFFAKLAELDPTKNTGLQIIELYYDLCAQNKIEVSELLKFKNAETLMNSLNKKRFSVSLSKDQAIAAELSKIKISSGIKASFKRNGDKRQIKLEIEADSPEQLQEKLEKSIKRTEAFKQAWNTES